MVIFLSLPLFHIFFQQISSLNLSLKTKKRENDEEKKESAREEKKYFVWKGNEKSATKKYQKRERERERERENVEKERFC